MIDYDNALFNIDITSGDMPHPGALLIAEPFLKDEYFSHAVICLVEYAMGGTAMGIVMNRSTAYTLQGLVKDVTRKKDIPIFCGGPMSCDRLYFVHTLGDIIPDAKEIKPGLFIGGDFQAMLGYVNAGYPIEGYIRFFIGYSGWSREQLDEELHKRVWAVTESADYAQLLTAQEDSYWHRAVRNMGNNFRGWRFHPKNPQAN